MERLSGDRPLQGGSGTVDRSGPPPTHQREGREGPISRRADDGAAGSRPVANRTRIGLVLREGPTVSPLELFFDLVFVLAITQCTNLMANHPSWRGIGHGLVVLGVLWWSWVGYAGLSSVVDPDEGGIRLVMFAAIAALLVTSLSVPDAFGDLGLTFAVAYATVRAANITLFVLASRDDPDQRRSVIGLAVSTAVSCGGLFCGALVHGDARLAVWLAAVAFDTVGPLVITPSGWRLVPGHFAERHGLIVIVALGESIAALGVGADTGVDGGVIASTSPWSPASSSSRSG